MVCVDREHSCGSVCVDTSAVAFAVVVVVPAVVLSLL
jgi:hypothetical protein